MKKRLQKGIRENTDLGYINRSDRDEHISIFLVKY